VTGWIQHICWIGHLVQRSVQCSSQFAKAIRCTLAAVVVNSTGPKSDGSRRAPPSSAPFGFGFQI
jgi:hypothetical protein